MSAIPSAISGLPNPTALALRLSAILTPLRALIAARLLRTPLAAIILPLWSYLGRVERRFARLAALHAAGHRPTPRPARSCSHGINPLLPTRAAWLLEALKHEAAAYRIRLETFLAEPETAAFLAASPTAASTIAPLCRMLGLPAPAGAKRPRRRRPAAEPAPRRARPAPEPAAFAPPPPAPRRIQDLCPRAAALWPFGLRKSPA